MTIPPPPMFASTTVGLNPNNSTELNYAIGNHLRVFVDTRETIAHDYNSLLGKDLKTDPYNMSEEDETLVKSALSELHTALQAVDMTFINRLTGLW